MTPSPPPAAAVVAAEAATTTTSAATTASPSVKEVNDAYVMGRTAVHHYAIDTAAAVAARTHMAAAPLFVPLTTEAVDITSKAADVTSEAANVTFGVVQKSSEVAHMEDEGKRSSSKGYSGSNRSSMVSFDHGRGQRTESWGGAGLGSTLWRGGAQWFVHMAIAVIVWTAVALLISCFGKRYCSCRPTLHRWKWDWMLKDEVGEERDSMLADMQRVDHSERRAAAHGNADGQDRADRTQACELAGDGAFLKEQQTGGLGRGTSRIARCGCNVSTSSHQRTTMEPATEARECEVRGFNTRRDTMRTHEEQEDVPDKQIWGTISCDLPKASQLAAATHASFRAAFGTTEPAVSNGVLPTTEDSQRWAGAYAALEGGHSTMDEPLTLSL